MYSCGAPFTRPIPACLVLPCPPLSACFCRLCGRKSPKNPLAAVPAVHIDHSLSFPSTFFLYPLAGSRKKKHTKHKEENSPIQVAGLLQKSLMMETGHETLDVLRSVKMRTDTKLLLSAMASFQLPTACYRMLSMPWRSRPYIRTGELTLRSLLPLTSSALVAVR
ncbi:hypothetical protein HDV62DRAFT_141707 [Trichoderma sp. SZMC 28011]